MGFMELLSHYKQEKILPTLHCNKPSMPLINYVESINS